MEWAIVIVVRLLVPLTILRWPLFGSVAAIVVDNLDVVMWDALGITDYSFYDKTDKALDIYLHLIQGYTMLYWQNSRAKNIGAFLLFYRLLGVGLFELTSQNILLFIFPNIFEFFFLFYLVYKKLQNKEPFATIPRTFVVLTALISLKLLQEYILHVQRFPVYQWIKENIFSMFI